MLHAHASHAFERLDDLAEPLLLEDAAGGDLTTEALGLHGRRGHVVFYARGPMTIAGTELAAAMFTRRGVPVVLHRRSGETVTGRRPAALRRRRRGRSASGVQGGADDGRNPVGDGHGGAGDGRRG